jgi:BASS family bile acid:Na+ symporter
MVAMFLFFPMFALAVTWIIPLDPAARIALLALAVSPMPPILPIKEQKLGGELDYVLAIQLAASLVALAAAPLMFMLAGQIFGREASFDALGVARTIMVTIVVPLGVGLGVAAIAPEAAARFSRPFRALGMTLLAVGFLIVIWQAWPGIQAAALSLTIVAAVLIGLFGLAVGHWLGGPFHGNRHALAVATISRHPGVAIGLAAAADLEPKQPIVAVVLMYLLVMALLGALYARLAKG